MLKMGMVPIHPECSSATDDLQSEKRKELLMRHLGCLAQVVTLLAFRVLRLAPVRVVEELPG